MAEKYMENKVVLLVDEEFEIADKPMFYKMNKVVFEFENVCRLCYIDFCG